MTTDYAARSTHESTQRAERHKNLTSTQLLLSEADRNLQLTSNANIRPCRRKLTMQQATSRTRNKFRTMKLFRSIHSSVCTLVRMHNKCTQRRQNLARDGLSTNRTKISTHTLQPTNMKRPTHVPLKCKPKPFTRILNAEHVMLQATTQTPHLAHKIFHTLVSARQKTLPMLTRAGTFSNIATTGHHISPKLCHRGCFPISNDTRS